MCPPSHDRAAHRLTGTANTHRARTHREEIHMSSTKVRKVVLNGHAGMPDSVTRAFQDRVPFNANNTLTAGYHTSVSGWDSGRLDREETDTLIQWGEMAKFQCVPLYIVYSYATPICWAIGANVYKVKQRFSVTTSKHQGRLY